MDAGRCQEGERGRVQRVGKKEGKDIKKEKVCKKKRKRKQESHS